MNDLLKQIQTEEYGKIQKVEIDVKPLPVKEESERNLLWVGVILYEKP